MTNTFTKKELAAIRTLVVRTRSNNILRKKINIELLDTFILVEKIDALLNELPSDKLEESHKDIYNISSYDDFYIITDTKNDIEYKINTDLVNDGKVASFSIDDRESRIDELESWIGESKSESDKYLMREDLEYLRESSEEFVLSYLDTNGYVAKDVEIVEFNRVCKEMIDAFVSYTNEVLNEKL